MPMSRGAQITMSIDEYDDLRNKLAAAHKEIGDLSSKLETARLADPSGQVQDLVDAVRAALPVVRYAVGELDPRVSTRWPFASLRDLASKLEALPGMEPDVRELAIELRVFADEAKRLEVDRWGRGVYDGPDPLDMTLLSQIATGRAPRLGRLVEAGYLVLHVTGDGAEALDDGASSASSDDADDDSHGSGNVADATKTP